MTVPVCTNVVVSVYNRAGTELRGTLSGLGLSWTDVFGDEPGEARLTAKALEAAMVADPDLLVDALVKVGVNLVPDGDPVDIFAFITQPGSGTLIGADEAAAVESVPIGRGVLALLNDWVVFPEGGFRERAQENRWIGWMSRDWPSFDDSLWDMIDAFVAAPGQVHDGPKKWPTILADAQWINAWDYAADPEDVKPIFMLRRTFTLAHRTRLRFYVAADRPWSLWCNSERFMGGDGDVKVISRRNIILPPGTYTVAIESSQDFASPDGDGGVFDDLVEAVRFGLVKLNADNEPVSVICLSETDDWEARWANEDEGRPGWTVGDIVVQLLSEAAARVVHSAMRIVCDFDGTVDSNGDPWPGTVDRTIKVGMSGLTLITDLGLTEADFDMTPDLHLKAYVAQGTDKSDTVSLLAGSTSRGVFENVLTYTWSATGIEATRMLVRTRNGFVHVVNWPSEDLWDRRELWVESGTTPNTGTGAALGESLLEDFSRIVYSYTAVIVAVEGCVPYLDFGKGDLITALDHTGAPTILQVVSIHGDYPTEGGPVRWTLELQEPPT